MTTTEGPKTRRTVCLFGQSDRALCVRLHAPTNVEAVGVLVSSNRSVVVADPSGLVRKDRGLVAET